MTSKTDSDAIRHLMAYAKLSGNSISQSTVTVEAEEIKGGNMVVLLCPKCGERMGHKGAMNAPSFLISLLLFMEEHK